MLSLPLVFISSAVLFTILLEERFKFITTFLGMTVAVLLSLALQPAVKSITAATDSWENNAVVLASFVFLVVSAFIFSNNIVHKIFVSLLMYLNYVFISDAAVGVMSVSLMPQGDVFPS